MSEHNAWDLGLPILKAKGLWGLPANVEPEMSVNTRGLPQGMASSVLLAGLATSPILGQLSLHDPTLSLWSYVDDLNLAASTREKLLESFWLLKGIWADFSLCMSNLKSTAWINVKRAKQSLHESTGFRSGGRGCLGEGRLELQVQVWELRFLPSFPSFPTENRRSKNVWESAWNSQTSLYQTCDTNLLKTTLRPWVDNG